MRSTSGGRACGRHGVGCRLVPAGRARRRVAGFALLAAPVVLVLVAGWSRRWLNEDAYINLRVVDQVFAGHGPVFNTGERVEASTSPAWIGVLRRPGHPRSPDAHGVGGGGGGAGGCRRRLRGGGPAPAACCTPRGPGPAPRPHAGGGRAGGVGLRHLGAGDGGRLAVDGRVLARAGQRRPRGRAADRAAACRLAGGPRARPADQAGPRRHLRGPAGDVVGHRPPRRRRLALDVAVAARSRWRTRSSAWASTPASCPTPALAKDAGGLHLRQGLTYLGDLVTTYWLAVPLAVIAVATGLTIARADRNVRAACIGMVAAAVAHAGYITVAGATTCTAACCCRRCSRSLVAGLDRAGAP